MSVEISEHDPAKAPQIQAAATEQWPFSDWWFSGDEDQVSAAMHASAQHNLCGGESEEQFTERLSLAIWRANGRYCCVVVDATYLESLPYETHSLDEDDYARLLKRKEATNARDQSAGDASGGGNG
jgi:hypothetical protein